ncbi:MAG: UDP-N-acetylglucosamine 2-epimerase, partial [Methanosarcina sp.]|nr:UDP-N-acetylglucosamine 2-epimerase [Methanosarcina sp.]
MYFNHTLEILKKYMEIAKNLIFQKKDTNYLLMSIAISCYYILKYIQFNVFFNQLKKKIISREIEILFSSSLNNWRDYKHKDGKNYEYDLMIGDVLEQSKKMFSIKCIDRDPTNKFRSKSATLNKYRNSDDWICIEQYITIKDVFKAFTYSIQSLVGMKIDDEFKKYFCIIGSKINVNSYMKLLICKNILHEIQPNILLLTCEYCPFHKEMVYTAHQYKIPTIALQHGIITDQHPGYMYDDKSFRAILPDVTCVFGEEHYKLLVEKSIYEPQKVVVTGNPRYDILNYAKKLYSREDFFKRYSLNPDNKIVLWTTQCHGISDKENKNNFKAMFKTLQNLKDVTLIIKQHPGEGEKYTKMIKDALKNHNLNIVITPKNSDTYEQLYMCDILVIKDSTTAMEAVALNKPVIVLNLSGEPDVERYVTEGVALGVYNEKDLKPTIEELLRDDFELTENRDKYIEQYLYKIDGKSTERVVQLIEKTLDE